MLLLINKPDRFTGLDGGAVEEPFAVTGGADRKCQEESSSSQGQDSARSGEEMRHTQHTPLYIKLYVSPLKSMGNGIWRAKILKCQTPGHTMRKSSNKSTYEVGLSVSKSFKSTSTCQCCVYGQFCNRNDDVHTLLIQPTLKINWCFILPLQEGTRLESVASYVIAGEGLYLFTCFITSLSATKALIGSNVEHV